MGRHHLYNEAGWIYVKEIAKLTLQKYKLVYTWAVIRRFRLSMVVFRLDSSCLKLMLANTIISVVKLQVHA